jgi:hypothetical protein
MEPLRYVAINHVSADQAADFDALVRDVVIPLVQRIRPHLADRWTYHVPETSETDIGKDLAYAMLFFGEDPLDNWDLEPFFIEGYGEEEGRRLNEKFENLLIRQDVYAFSPNSGVGGA